MKRREFYSATYQLEPLNVLLEILMISDVHFYFFRFKRALLSCKSVPKNQPLLPHQPRRNINRPEVLGPEGQPTCYVSIPWTDRQHKAPGCLPPQAAVRSSSFPSKCSRLSRRSCSAPCAWSCSRTRWGLPAATTCGQGWGCLGCCQPPIQNIQQPSPSWVFFLSLGTFFQNLLGLKRNGSRGFIIVPVGYQEGYSCPRIFNRSLKIQHKLMKSGR